MSVQPATTLYREAPDACLSLVKHFEGFRAAPYLDPAGFLTVGYGHKITHSQMPIYQNRQLSEPQADQLARIDLDGAAQQLCAHLPPDLVVSLTDGQYAALVDWVFNLGIGNFNGSTLHAYLENSRLDGVPDQLVRWVHAGGQVLPDLVRRRAAEVLLWQGATIADVLAAADRAA